MTLPSCVTTPPTIRGRRFDPVAAVLFAVGVLSLLWVSGLDFRNQDANWDLLNYHAYVPASLLNGTWFSDVHPAYIQSYQNPYQDLLMWPLVSGVPAPIATAVILALQLSIFIPLGLILRATVPSLSRPRALAIGLIGVSGAMMMTELGVTQGDVPPAILVAWALYLILSVLADQAGQPGRRAVLAGVLVGAAVALKYTVFYIAPGLLVVAAFLMVAGMRRSALLFLLSSFVATLILCAPWALVLQANVGSPVFPFFNAIFHAPRYPAIDFHDDRFGVNSIVGLIELPIRQGLYSLSTSEIPNRDVRWVIGILVAGLAVVITALRSCRPGTRDRWRAHLPGLALLMFWVVSYVAWAWEFGIQRYAIPLEGLALPVIVTGAALLVPRLLASRSSLVLLILLAAVLARTTTIVDFGRRPMGWAPIVPTETIEPLTRYDAIVVEGGPLAFLRAVTRDAPGASSQVWLDPPLTDADRAVEEKALAGRSVGILFYVGRDSEAAAVAAGLGFRVTGECETFDNPLANSDLSTPIEICSTSRLTTTRLRPIGVSGDSPTPTAVLGLGQARVGNLDDAYADTRWTRRLYRS